MAGGKILLKITGYLMIIGGVLGIIFGAIAIAGMNAFADTGVSKLSLVVSGAFAIISGIVELFAGIKGVRASNDPAKAEKCIRWGFIVIVFSLIGQIISVAGGSKFNVTSLIIGLVVPVLYIIGAFIAKKAE